MQWKSIDDYPKKDGTYHCKGVAPGDCPVIFVASFDKRYNWSFFYPDHGLSFPWPYINVMWLDD